MERMIEMLAWEEIMSKSPTMKKLIEDKIAAEIEPLKQENAALRTELEELKTLVQGEN